MVEQPERYCSNCGHELKPEDQFCSNCGMPVHRAARVPTPMADRPVPPLPPPTREAGRRSFRGSGALRGRWRKLVVVLVVGALLLYLVLPLVMESLIAWRLPPACRDKLSAMPRRPLPLSWLTVLLVPASLGAGDARDEPPVVPVGLDAYR